MISSIVARARRSDDRWLLSLPTNLESENYPRDYAANGHSLSLAILIHVTRQHLRLFCQQPWQSRFSFILDTASKFNIQDTSPELRHNFCLLWNEVVLEAQNTGSTLISQNILNPFAIFTSLYTRILAPPRRASPPPLAKTIVFCGSHGRT
ncbi:hypothetical protein EI94DRAFT_644476 [Lactarius quietus]|nr:hypothetical protein EI94DRAFT_644476 [Lactarius quietus]